MRAGREIHEQVEERGDLWGTWGRQPDPELQAEYTANPALHTESMRKSVIKLGKELKHCNLST